MAMVYVISILKLAPLSLLIFVGFPHIEWAGVAGADIPGTETLGQSMLVLMYAFIGFEFSLIAAGETRNARTAIPRSSEERRGGKAGVSTGRSRWSPSL